MEDDDVPSEANATTVAVLVPENASGANLVRGEQVAELVLIHTLRQVGNVKVGVTLVRKRLQLGVEGLLRNVSGEANGSSVHITHPSKANFIPEVMETTNTVLSIFVIVVFDKAEAVRMSARSSS